ncbi:MAG: glycerol-3-phosphate 1-O-acyltransferase PlsY [Acidaminococcus sp.]|uniref:glycerol-3-phosphate 1-O-acyltransferase PlsY n=1 Tax=Acidaminococcus TaxID=904 RepID=UPI002591F34B|nr:glycerol-3-phosphate 1-O-acyltransferase PlsY [Acidaminococcus sp.]MDO5596963.1 glycerol-3-phosphate 1-O-acyltransferase PlsY [Acidaminococcus sp.]
MDYLWSALIGYLLGSISCGLLLVKWICGIDIRDYGSHNIGATNVFRTVGARMASFVLLGDLLKGVLALYLVNHFVSGELPVLLVCAVSAIVGHSFSWMCGFKGGKGVATGLGILLYLMPEVALFSLTIWLATVFVTRYVSLGSILAAIAAPLSAWYLRYDWRLVVFVSLCAIMVVARHYQNILRLKNGTESKIRQGHLKK